MRLSPMRTFSLLYFIVIITIDASRVLYFPSPKLRSTHYESKSSAILPSTTRNSHEQALTDDDFIPFSALHSNIFEEAQNSQNNDLIDWETLVDKEAAINALLSDEDRDELSFLSSLDRQTRKPTNIVVNNDAANSAAMNNPSELSEQNGIESPWHVDTATSRFERLQAVETVNSIQQNQRRNDIVFLVIVATSTVVGILGLIAALIFWYKIQQKSQAALDADYPSYGISGTGINPNLPKSAASDRKLAQSAQMFHYQQQRQQMMAQEKAQFETKPVNSDDSDDDAPGGGDYTVYECPGLAPTGEMEVRNPLFAEPDPSMSTALTASYPTVNNHYPQPSSSPPKEKSSP